MPLDNTPGSITEPQSKFIAGLVEKKQLTTLTHEQQLYLRAGDYSGMSKAVADKAIKKLLDLPDIEDEVYVVDHDTGLTSDEVEPDETIMQRGDIDYSPVRPLVKGERELLNDKLTELESKVDAGYYFVVNSSLIDGGRHDPNDGERFYHVTKPEPPSRWAGYTFIESRGGDYLYKVKDVKHRIAVLEEILKDPITAMNEYGIRLGVCGCCGRTLTAKDSRLRGLGPICAAKILGAPTQSQLELLNKLGLR